MTDCNGEEGTSPHQAVGLKRSRDEYLNDQGHAEIIDLLDSHLRASYGRYLHIKCQHD